MKNEMQKKLSERFAPSRLVLTRSFEGVTMKLEKSIILLTRFKSFFYLNVN